MASTGQLITKASFSTSWAGTYTDSTGSSGASEFYFISAPSFVVEVSSASGLFNQSRSIVEMLWYNYRTGGWTQLYYKDYVGPGDRFKFYHNRDAESSNGNYNARDSADSRWSHLFLLRAKKTYGNGSQSIGIWYGGPGLMTDSEYNAYCKGKRICSCGSLTEWVWRSGRSDDGNTVNSWKSQAVAKFNPANNRGTRISAGYADRCTYDRYYFGE